MRVHSQLRLRFQLQRLSTRVRRRTQGRRARRVRTRQRQFSEDSRVATLDSRAPRAIRGACVHRLHVSMVSMCALLESSSRRRATCRRTNASYVARGVVAMDSVSVGGQGVSKRNSRVSCMVLSWGVIFWTPRTHFGRSNLRTRFGIGNAGSVTEPYSRRWVALLQIYQLNVIDKHVGQHQSCSVAKVLRSLVTAQSASNHFSSSTSDI